MAENIFDNLKEIQLKNGFKIYYLIDKTHPVFSLQVYSMTGSVFEPVDLRGMSHFLEHMLFKGSKNLKTGDVAKIVEGSGCIMNAGTSYDYTVYWIDGPKNAFEKVVAVLYDLFTAPTFPPDELEKERNVILEEIRRVNDEPDRILWEKLLERLYKTANYRYRVIGEPSTIKNIKREDITSYHKKFYTPQNSFAVAVGDIDIEKLKIFEEWNNKNSLPHPAIFEDDFDPSFEVIKDKKLKQGYIAVAFLGGKPDSDDFIALEVASSILTSGRSSKLVRNLREEKRLVQSISSEYVNLKGTGFFVVNARFDPENLIAVKDEIINELKNFKVTNEELKKAVKNIASSYHFAVETYHGIASYTGYSIVIGRKDMPSTYIKKIKKLKPSDIENTLKKYFKKYVGVAIVPGS